jgi:hypothetical protein
MSSQAVIHNCRYISVFIKHYIIISLFNIGKTKTNTLSKDSDEISSQFISDEVSSLTDNVLLCQVDERNVYDKRRLADNWISKYLGIRPLWNKSNLVYVLFGREKFCLV